MCPRVDRPPSGQLNDLKTDPKGLTTMERKMHTRLERMIPHWVGISLTTLIMFLLFGCDDAESQRGVGTEQAPTACDPGTVFDASDGCNTCTCPESGIKSEANCTLMTCEPYNPCWDKTCGDGESPSCDGDIARPVWSSTCDLETGECMLTIGPQPQDCAAIGLICRDGACVPSDADVCVPGDFFDADDGCNSCECPDSGLKSEAYCTELSCDALACEGRVCGEACTLCPLESGGDCAETEEPKFCNIEGECQTVMQVVCEEEDLCIPGDTFLDEDGCNTCTCPDSGIESEAVCTEMSCTSVGDFMALEGGWSYSTFDTGVSSCEGVAADIASSLSEEKGFTLSNVTDTALNWRIDGLPEAASCNLSGLSVTCEPLTGDIDNDYGLTLPTVININGNFSDSSTVSGTYTANIGCEGGLCATAEALYSISFPCTFDFNFGAVSN